MQVDWLNINPMTGGTGQTEVYGYVAPNEIIGCTRNATVRFTNNEGLYADLNLSQSSDTSDMRFVVTPDYLYVPGGGGTYNVNVLTNTYWKVTEYDSSLTITSDNMEGYGDGILTIVIPQNPNTNNWYGYDHNGRPFYGRDGYITVTSLMGTKRILWEQAAYKAITVTPNRLVFPQTGGTLPVTVKSAMDWEIISYDSAHTSFSVLSGHSGETTIYVTKSALTQTQIEYYTTCPSTAEFNDGSNVALLFMDSTFDDYYIDDDWITVTYDVPSANTEVILYAYESDLAIVPTVQFQDDNHTEVGRNSIQIDYQRFLGQYYTTFTTEGEHTVKYKFNKDGCIIPKYGFPAGNILGVRGTACYKSIVIGNRCQGSIYACAAKGTGFKEVVLGLGNITGIGELAFEGCGSYETDFVFGNNVASYTYQPFHNMKAKKFVYNRTELGGESGETQTVVTSGCSKFIISGSTFSFADSNTVTATTNYGSWNYPGDISCIELVIGQKVETIHNTPFYPYGLSISKVNKTTGQANYIYAGASFSTGFPINGWSVNSISCVSRVSPSVDRYSFTPVTQTFRRQQGQVHYGVFATATKGPQRSIPFHYPIGADYSAWSSEWSNMIGDLDI